VTTEVTIKIHRIDEDGLPDMDALVGRVAFLFDGNIVSGWPLHVDPENDRTAYSGRWEADRDVGHHKEFAGVTHWVEFPEAIWNLPGVKA
jgi:hypothetical protein